MVVWLMSFLSSRPRCLYSLLVAMILMISRGCMPLPAMLPMCMSAKGSSLSILPARFLISALG